MFGLGLGVSVRASVGIGVGVGEYADLCDMRGRRLGLD